MNTKHGLKLRQPILAALILTSIVAAAALSVATNLASNVIPQSWEKKQHYSTWIIVATVLLVLLAWLVAIAIQKSEQNQDSEENPPLPPAVPWMIPIKTRTLVSRPPILDGLLSALAKPSDTVSPKVVALIGPGGFGKTTIAEEFGRIPQLRQRFPGGLLWITVGALSGADLASRIGFLAEQLGAERPGEADPIQAGIRLAALLDRRRPTLLVIDDVWTKDQLAPFLQGGTRCSRLITTRNIDIAPPASIRIPVNEMSAQQSLKLLAIGSLQVSMNTFEPLLPATGGWPLLLALINGLMTDLVANGASPDKAVSTYLSLLNKNGPAALDQVISDDGRSHLVATTIEASLSRLIPEHRDRFLELGIFPPGIYVPREAAVRLWKATAEMEPEDADALCHRLSTLSLLSSYRFDSLRLHDIIRSYLRNQSEDLIESYNRKFIDDARPLLRDDLSSGATLGTWWRLPDNEDYLWENLAFHLNEAGKSQELSETVQDLRWIRRRIQRWGAAAAEADLSYSNQLKSDRIRSQIARYSHLLRSVNYSLDATSNLVNYIGQPLALDIDTKALVDDREAGCLYPRWPPPETSASPVTRVLSARQESLHTILISPDGRSILTGGQDGHIDVWNAITGKLKSSMIGDDYPIYSLDVSADGAWVASGSGNGIVRVWDLHNCELYGTMTGHQEPVTAVSFFKNNETLATVSHDGTMRIWSVSNCQLRRTWHLDSLIRRVRKNAIRLMGLEPLPTDALNAMILSPDNSLLIIGTYNRGIRILDSQTGKIKIPIETRHDVVDAMSISPDGTKLAVGWGTGYEPFGGGSPLSIYDLSDKTESHYPGHEGALGCIQFSPDGQWVATAGQDAVIRLWDSATWHNYTNLWGPERGVTDLAISPDGTWLATACWDGTARILRASGALEKDLNRYPSMHAIAISTDDRWLAASGTKRTELRRLPAGKIAHSFEGGDEVTAIDPHGKWFAISAYGSIKLLPLRRGAKPLTLTQSAASVRTLATAGDGSWLAAAGGGTLNGKYVIRVWDTRTGKIRKTFEGHTDRIAELRWIPGTNFIASAGMDRTVRIWDLDDVQDSVTLSGHEGWVTALTVSPDATWLASGSDDNTVRVWNLSDYSLRAVLNGHSNHVRELASSPDGTWLASGGFDDTVRIWDASSGETRKVLLGHSEWIQSITISPDGQWVATSGWDNTLRVWNANTGSCDASFRSEGLIRQCSWLSDGRTLAAAGISGLYLWSYLAPKRGKSNTT